ncbi:regulator of nucleoside diphosphate kinase [Mariniflexile fucanivorans]|uniref:Regulator of nucleoside diphosphate kinase n=1 Tax=Mariniflexile fucanivorans TaxID=264023 RepID=A0A4R1RJ76_9FLAO|nr:GreA/GreB family elongation factor [Mariniflexile fucanivorans]TCL66175.1 regulator of nucleoside diphosphate kinase [Mariniflexile fucanivorans]
MKYGSIMLEKKEYVYIKRILNISGYVGDHEIQKSLAKFSEELKSAHILDEAEMPDDVVRLNSIVRVTVNNNWEKSIQIVQPSEKDIKNNKISILTTMGSALMGYSKDDIIEWDFPNGKQQIKITEVTQEGTFSPIEIIL